MQNFFTKLYVYAQILREDAGQDLIEYVLIIAIIAFAATVGMSSVAPPPCGRVPAAAEAAQLEPAPALEVGRVSDWLADCRPNVMTRSVPSPDHERWRHLKSA